MPEYKIELFPFNEVLRAAERAMNQGAKVYQQFKCAGCGAKQTMPDPDGFYLSGKCEECGHLTDIHKDGCNFMVVIGLTEKGKQQKPKGNTD